MSSNIHSCVTTSKQWLSASVTHATAQMEDYIMI